MFVSVPSCLCVRVFVCVCVFVCSCCVFMLCVYVWLCVVHVFFKNKKNSLLIPLI